MADSQPQERRNRRPEMVPEEKQFDERTLHIDRVARVVKGGRRFRFRATVVVGDGRGRAGVGVGKGGEVMTSIAKAVSTPAHPLHLDAGFSINGWLAVLLTFLLARVFAEGTRMREDLEGTV